MIIDNCLFPDELFYDLEENVWIRRENDAVAIGITCVYAFIAGRVETVKFKPLVTFLERGKSVATIESARFFSAVRTPISGKLIKINKELVSAPSLANKHPYSLGWFAKILPVSRGEKIILGA
ncbi:MAG TPA: hypothetical protein VN739_01385 [Nitrososphaerales archaeon]|nr:hypothetical protein [Nitrososphaerales archaeon]